LTKIIPFRKEYDFSFLEIINDFEDVKRYREETRSCIEDLVSVTSYAIVQGMQVLDENGNVRFGVSYFPEQGFVFRGDEK